MKNVITLDKLIRLLLSSLPFLVLLSVNVHAKNTRNELTHPVMGMMMMMNKSQETTVFSGRQKLTSAMKLRPEK